MSENNINNTENLDTPNVEKTNKELKEDFNSELEQQQKSLNAAEFAKKQEQYRQIVATTNQSNDNQNDIYVWRIGFGRRLGAYFIDNIFYILFLLIALSLTGITEDFIEFIPMMSDVNQIMQYYDKIVEFSINRFLPLSLAVRFVYYSLEIIFGQSLGKMLLGIIIGSANKKNASYPQLILRFAIKFSNSIMSLLLLITTISIFNSLSLWLEITIFIGSFFVLSRRKQALHDLIAKTAVYFKDELKQLGKENKQ